MGSHCCTLYPGVSTNCLVKSAVQLYSQKAGFLREINIHYVRFVLSSFWKYVNVNSGVPGDSNPHPYYEVLTKVSRIPISMKVISVTT
jgi:hypothetical protein